MARRFSPADLAAAVAAGVGLWFTRASLDVFADNGRTVRVAMLPAPLELPGLVALAALGAVLLRTALARRGRGSHRPSDGPPDLLLPLLSLLAIAIPYLPWLADAVPAWRALAGPARFALWAVVCGQVLWIGIDAAARRGGRPYADDAVPNRSSWSALIVILATAAAAAGVLASAPESVVSVGPASDGTRLILYSRIILGALASVLIWRLAERAAGSCANATIVWLAIAGSATFVIGGALMATTFAAIACVAVALGWRGDPNDRHTAAVAVRVAALAILPWLHAPLLPLALVGASSLAWRTRSSRAGRLLVLVPVLASGGAAAVALAPARGPMPSAATVVWAAAALLVDQQDGLLFYAPALLLLTAGGLWRLWRDGGAARLAALETLAASAAALLAALWQSGSRPAMAIPGAPLAPLLPFLALPIARWLRDGAGGRARIELARALVLWGLVATGLLVLARDGLVLLRSRDGASALLDWLEPLREVVRLAPIARPGAAEPFAFTALALIWLAGAAAVGRLVLMRSRSASDGAAAVAVVGTVLAGATLGAAVVDATLGRRVPARVAPALTVDSRLLAGFDARRRPLAIAYDPWQVLEPSAVPPLFSFDATRGARRHPQPLPVLLNTRLSLPAGDYEVMLQPNPGAALAGLVGLQVGRMGPPMRWWHVAAAPGESWSGTFTLPVDASFVGLRAERELETAVDALRIRPAHVVNATDRRDLPAVLSSAIYGGAMVTFHTDAVYPERAGFWVRGRSTLLATFTPPRAEGRGPGVRLSVHAGPATTRVRFEAPAWHVSVLLEPGVSHEVPVPAQGTLPLLVRISADAGFIPADVSGGTDRRLLGCWIEVLE